MLPAAFEPVMLLHAVGLLLCTGLHRRLPHLDWDVIPTWAADAQASEAMAGLVLSSRVLFARLLCASLSVQCKWRPLEPVTWLNIWSQALDTRISLYSSALDAFQNAWRSIFTLAFPSFHEAC